MNLLKQSYVKYGLIMTATTVLCLALMELSGQNESFDMKSPFQLFYMFLAPAIIWYFGIREKKKALGNKLTFKQGLIEGLKISLVYGLVSPFVFLGYYLFINPGILEYVRTAYGLTTASDAAVIAADMLAQLIAAIIFGGIYAAIISLFLKSRN